MIDSRSTVKENKTQPLIPVQDMCVAINGSILCRILGKNEFDSACEKSRKAKAEKC